MGSVWGDKAHEREGVHPVMFVTKLSSLCKCLASKKFGSTVVMSLPARVVARSSTPSTASTDSISLCVTSLTTRRVFATSQCWARTTIEEIILNLNVWGSRRGRGRFWPAPGRGPTSSTLSNGNLLCWFLIN